MSAFVRLLGLDFADVDAPHAAELLARRPADEPFGYVVTPNADHLVRLHRQPRLAPLYVDAMLRLMDSRVVCAGVSVCRVAHAMCRTRQRLDRRAVAGPFIGWRARHHHRLGYCLH